MESSDGGWRPHRYLKRPKPTEHATDEQSSLAPRVPDNGAENAAKATEKARDKKQQKSMSHGGTDPSSVAGELITKQLTIFRSACSPATQP